MGVSECPAHNLCLSSALPVLYAEAPLVGGLQVKMHTSCYNQNWRTSFTFLLKRLTSSQSVHSCAVWHQGDAVVSLLGYASARRQL